MITDEQRAETMGKTTKAKLKSIIARIERLEAEKVETSADITQVYAEAKTFGFDTKVLRKTIAARKVEPHEREEQEALLDLYMDAAEN